MRTPLNALLGIEQPILLAPMAGIGGGALAVAVSRAGGLGFIGGGYGDEAWLRAQLELAEDTRFGVGFISWALERKPAPLDVALAAKPRAVMLSFGSVARFADRVRSAGALLIAQVQSVAQAREAAAEGAQIIVAQGTEAGGHGGERSTLPLVPAVVEAVGPLPVVAAGGIADGRGLAAALRLGAVGVLCGTVFYASEESLANPRAKRRLVEASGDATRRSPVFDRVRGLEWPAPWQLRALRNDFSERWADDPAGLQAGIEAEQSRYAAARDGGDFATAAVIAGEAADLVRSIASAEAIIRGMVARATALLAAAPAHAETNITDKESIPCRTSTSRSHAKASQPSRRPS